MAAGMQIRTDRPPVATTATTTGATIATRVVAAVVAVTAGLWFAGGGLQRLADPGGMWLVLGQWAGFVAALAALAGLVLVARPVGLQRSAGLDQLWRWHRITGITTIVALAVHAVASPMGFAGGSPGRLWNTVTGLLAQPWLVAATVAGVLFAIVAGTSWRRLRQRMAYETWYFLHLSGYLAVALAFGHQVVLGSDLATDSIPHRALRWWWIGLAIVVAAVVLWSRAGVLVRSATLGRARVVEVRPVDPRTYTMVLAAPALAARVRPGQFVVVRVLTGDLWWQPHPVSLSARPRNGLIRLTLRSVGDGTELMRRVRPGTRVWLEGPYGRFTAERAHGRPVVLIGGGVGLAPLRAVLEDLAPPQSPVVVARVPNGAALPHAEEFRRLLGDRGGRLLVVPGPRQRWRGGPFRPELITAAVPDIAERDVFVCGPPGMEGEVERSLRAAGVPAARIHIERFGV